MKNTFENIRQIIDSLRKYLMEKLRVMSVFFGVFIFCVLSGCASRPSGDLRVQTKPTKDIFIFIDGTRNNANSQTNTRIMYEVISEHAPRNTVTFYVEGVGDARHPLFGMVFGKGGSSRVELGYTKIMQTYQPGDRIYIFGFSRGAVYARALAGLLSYAGVPKLTSSPKTPQQYEELSHTIHEYVKTIDDNAVENTQWWSSWDSGTRPKLAQNIKEIIEKKHGVVVKEIMPIEINMLGVWDSVPGSAFKTYKKTSCTQADSSGGSKFKTNTYPTIHNMFHAIAADEKRDRFQVLRFCNPMNTKVAQKVEERVFPGSHSDVGGGYPDSDKKLSSISLKWMVQKLSDTGYVVPEQYFAPYLTQTDAALTGVAHWSRYGAKNVLVTKCKERKLFQQNNDLKSDKWKNIIIATPDASLIEREKQGYGWIKTGLRSKPVKMSYPITCKIYQSEST